MIVGDLDFIFNNLEESINKETADLNNTINQIDLTGMYRTFYPTVAECIYSSQAHMKYF